MRFLPCGDTALLIELRPDHVLGTYELLRARDLAGVTDLVPAASTILVRIDPAAVSIATIARAIAATGSRALPRRPGDHLQVPVRYDGADLDEVGELTGLGRAGVVELHTGQLWQVAFAGFAPGFGYLVADQRRIHVPRRTHPRPRVPAGAVGLADAFTGIYPRSTPGGWQLIGRTTLEVWDVHRSPPSLLTPGVTVRFVPST